MRKGTQCFLFRPAIPHEEIKSRSSIFVLIATGTAVATKRRKTTSGNADVITQNFSL
jgi:hypothetical protein